MAAQPRQADDLDFVLHEAVCEAPVVERGFVACALVAISRRATAERGADRLCRGYASIVAVPDTAGTLYAAGEFTGLDIYALESRFHESYLARIFQLSLPNRALIISGKEVVIA
jgi:hypothetical protein